MRLRRGLCRLNRERAGNRAATCGRYFGQNTGQGPSIRPGALGGIYVFGRHECHHTRQAVAPYSSRVIAAACCAGVLTDIRPKKWHSDADSQRGGRLRRRSYPDIEIHIQNDLRPRRTHLDLRVPSCHPIILQTKPALPAEVDTTRPFDVPMVDKKGKAFLPKRQREKRMLRGNIQKRHSIVALWRTRQLLPNIEAPARTQTMFFTS